MPLGSALISTIDIDFTRAQGIASTGRIWFQPPRQKVGTTMLSGAPIPINLIQGVATVDLTRLPQGTYRVVEQIDGRPDRAYNFALPLTAPAVVQYEDIVQVNPIPAWHQYVSKINGISPDRVTGNITLESLEGPKGDPGDDGEQGAPGADGTLYPLSAYGYHSCSENIGCFRDSGALGEMFFARVWVPAGKTITKIGTFCRSGGVVGAGGLNGFGIWSDDGSNLLYSSPNDDAMWTVTGEIVKILDTPIPSASVGRFFRCAMSSRGYSTPPLMNYVTGSPAITGLGGRRGFYIGGQTIWPASFNPATFGSESGGYLPLILLG